MSATKNVAHGIKLATSLTSDTVDLGFMVVAIKAKAAGNIRILDGLNNDVTLSFSVDEIKHVVVKRVFATSTTVAAGSIELYIPRFLAMPFGIGAGIGLSLDDLIRPFTPLDLGSQLKLLLEADAGVTTAGGAVSNWTDQSGNGNTATQGTGTAQPPHFNSGGPNNKPYIQFTNAGADILTIADAASLKPTSLSIFLVAKRTESNTFRTPLIKSTAAGWTDGFGIQTGAAGNQLSFFVNNFSTGGVATLSWTSGAWNTWHCRYNLSTVLVDRDNGAATNSASYSTAITHSTALAGIGNQNAQAFRIGADIAAIALCSALSDADAAKMFSYFKTKYATPLGKLEATMADTPRDERHVIDAADWPGIDPTGVTDSAPAIQAMLDRYLADYPPGAWVPGPRIVFPRGTYKIANSIDIYGGLVELTTADNGYAWATKFEIAADLDYVFRVVPYGQSPRSGTSGARCILRNLSLVVRPGFSVQVGILAQASVRVRDCYFNGFATAGIEIDSSGEGKNCNGFEIASCEFHRCGHGVWAHGSDSNAGTVYSCKATNCTNWGFRDGSLLGNQWISCLAEECGAPVDINTGLPTDSTRGNYLCSSPSSYAVAVGCYAEAGWVDWRGGIIGGNLAAFNNHALGSEQFGMTRSRLICADTASDRNVDIQVNLPVAKRSAVISFRSRNRDLSTPACDFYPDTQQDGWWELVAKDNSWLNFWTLKQLSSPPNPQTDLSGRPIGWTNSRHPLGPGHAAALNSFVNTRHEWAHKYPITVPPGKLVHEITNSDFRMFDAQNWAVFHFEIEGREEADLRVGAYRIVADNKIRVTVYNTGSQAESAQLVVHAKTVRTNAAGW